MLSSVAMDTQAEHDKAAYALGHEYLLSLEAEGVTQELLSRYLHGPDETVSREPLSHAYKQLLISAQSAERMQNVIGKAIGDMENLREVLCDFDVSRILEAYGEDWARLLDDIEREVKPRAPIRKEKRSLWPKFCKTALSGAKFLSQFSCKDDFYDWLDSFDSDDRARPALPLLLAHEVWGFGFALSCDFLKNIGYHNFAKPDVHIRNIFVALKLCPECPKDDYLLLKAVVRVACNAETSPYNVDKIFWLIGSGNFRNWGRTAELAVTRSRLSTGRGPG